MIRIKNIHIRNYRSLRSSSVSDCGPLNVLIGKNNAGKSSVLSVIPIVIDHLRIGSIASSWDVLRPEEQFTNREWQHDIQIGIEFTLPSETVDRLCSELTGTAPQLSKGIDQLKREQSISFILSRRHDVELTFQYIESISLGSIDASGLQLEPSGILILSTPPKSAAELFANYKAIARLESGITAIDLILTGPPDYNISAYYRERERPSFLPRYILDKLRSTMPIDEQLSRELTQLIEKSETFEDFKAKAQAAQIRQRDDIEKIRHTEISTPLKTYTGETRTQPSYVTELCTTYGALKVLRLEERKQPIGRSEAGQLLSLKVTRGGPDRLRSVQNTVKSLLGVSLDAFQSEGRNDRAEIDVDNFLAEANGAGIRESLRLVLDLELGLSDIVLLEEPEVHLHPGLEFSVYGYLQEKSRSKQIFLTTHSTNFVDASSPKNIYLISRDASGVATCASLSEDDAPIVISSELGIRLSTVFMFDRIVFVEGQTDEKVLRELASKLSRDIAGSGVAFVQLGGIDNFAHYATEATLDILCRRRVKMWFLVDRDERDDADVQRMRAKLGDQAKLIVLERRELENFLIQQDAVLAFIEQKTGVRPTEADYKAAFNTACADLHDEVIRVHLEKNLLKPIYLRGRGNDGDIRSRIESKISELTARADTIAQARAELERDLPKPLPAELAIQKIPGEILLDAISKAFGARFQKKNGDSVKLAKLLDSRHVPRQLSEFITEITDHSP